MLHPNIVEECLKATSGKISKCLDLDKGFEFQRKLSSGWDSVKDSRKASSCQSTYGCVRIVLYTLASASLESRLLVLTLDIIDSSAPDSSFELKPVFGVDLATSSFSSMYLVVVVLVLSMFESCGAQPGIETA